VFGLRFLRFSTLGCFNIPHRFLNKFNELLHRPEAIRTTTVNMLNPTCEPNRVTISL